MEDPVVYDEVQKALRQIIKLESEIDLIALEMRNKYTFRGCPIQWVYRDRKMGGFIVVYSMPSMVGEKDSEPSVVMEKVSSTSFSRFARKIGE